MSKPIGPVFLREDLAVENARLTAQVKDLREALGKFMSWLDDGTLVRGITKDDSPDWSIKMLWFVHDLKKAAVILKDSDEQN